MPESEKQYLWRVVLDTNVFIAAFLSRNLKSPNRELIQRWLKGDFILLTSSRLTIEIIEKLKKKKIQPLQILRVVTNLAFLAENIELDSKDIKRIVQKDPDDDMIIACAVKGAAQYIITYDPHILELGTTIQGIKITEPLPFLFDLRKVENT
ncbi:MAG: putative toxin-antitoxin system toxin component, PIN family [bacterium]